MKYILRTLWVIGVIPMILLGFASTFVYLMAFPIVAAFIFIKTGNLNDKDILLPNDVGEWFLDKYNGLINKIK